MIKFQKRNIIIKILFIIYCIFLIYILFISKKCRNNLRMVNLEPFATLNRYIRALKKGYIEPKIAYLNIGANLILFAPMGFFLPILFKNKIISFLFINTIIISSIELMQYITYTGSADVDDLILNLLGAIVTYILVKNRVIKNKCKIAIDKNKLQM